ncbi:MAG TPA: SRPBCC family protein [Steroidobacteraceae bacterium]|nr:SRPBCC family protein [Steroidobacteraceae bacterium]
MRVSYRAALAALGLIAVATSAQAIESKASKTTSQSVDAVWQKIGDFCGIAQWHPAIAKCELTADKKDRTLTLKGGGSIVEHLVRWSNKTHSYTYKIVSGPLPVDNYVSTLRVSAAKSGSGSVISWRGHYTAKGASDADAKKAIDGVYDAGLTALAGS